MIEKKKTLVVPNHYIQYLDDTLVTPWQHPKAVAKATTSKAKNSNITRQRKSAVTYYRKEAMVEKWYVV